MTRPTRCVVASPGPSLVTAGRGASQWHGSGKDQVNGRSGDGDGGSLVVMVRRGNRLAVVKPLDSQSGNAFRDGREALLHVVQAKCEERAEQKHVP
jgi:hypothetical protein